MKTVKCILLVLGIGLAGIGTASAHDSFSIGFNIGGPGYYAPPPVRYYAPPPVVYAPPPVYYAPPPVYYRPYEPRIYYRSDWGYRNDWGGPRHFDHGHGGPRHGWR